MTKLLLILIAGLPTDNFTIYVTFRQAGDSESSPIISVVSADANELLRVEVGTNTQFLFNGDTPVHSEHPERSAIIDLDLKKDDTKADLSDNE